MGTFTVSLTGSGVINGSKSWTISDADVQRLVDYLVAKYTSPVTLSNDSPPVQVGGVPTPQQAMVRWINSFVAQTKMDVRDRELRSARDQVSVTDIEFT